MLTGALYVIVHHYTRQEPTSGSSLFSLGPTGGNKDKKEKRTPPPMSYESLRITTIVSMHLRTMPN